MPSELLEAGPHIARHYLKASTQKKRRKELPTESWWLTDGQPLLLIQYHREEVAALPKFSRSVNADTLSPFDLTYCPVERNGRLCGIWFLRFNRPMGLDALRRLRIHLFRLHAERECLRQILRLILQQKIRVDAPTQALDNLQDYLLKSVRLLSREKVYGFSQSGILEAAQEFVDLVSPGERQTLLSQLDKINKDVLRNVSRFTEPRPDTSATIHVLGGQPTINVGNFQKIGGQVVTNYNINLGGNTVVHGDFVVANSIQNSFNKVSQSNATQELKDRFTELSQAVAEMTKQLPAERARQASSDLEALTKETISDSPRREWYELSAKGLVEAAKAVGEIGVPVVKCVKALLALLM